MTTLAINDSLSTFTQRMPSAYVGSEQWYLHDIIRWRHFYRSHILARSAVDQIPDDCFRKGYGWGRDIKGQVGSLEVVNPKITCSEGPIGGRTMPMVASQYGPLTMTGGAILVDGVAVGVVVNTGGSDAIGNSASKWTNTPIRLKNGATIDALLFHAPNSGPSVKNVSRMEGITVEGGPVVRACEVRTNGNENDIIFVTGCVAEFTGELVRAVTRGGGVSPYFAKVISDGNVNIGSEVPVVRFLEPGIAARVKATDHNSVGFTTTPFLTLAGNSFGGLDSIEYRGSSGVPTAAGSFPIASDRFFCVQILNEVTYNLPFHGPFSSNLVLMSVQVGNGAGKSIFATGNNAVTSLASSADVVFGAGTEPATGQWRIWRPSAGVISIKNASGTDRTVSFLQM